MSEGGSGRTFFVGMIHGMGRMRVSVRRRSGALAALLVVVPAFLIVNAADTGRQPIEFPHDKHVARGMECIDCHSRADTRAEAGIPSIRKCMFCHKTLFPKGAGVKQVQEYSARRIEAPWVRVYGFEQSALVKFQHAPHVRSGVECKTCHGEVEKMTVAQPVVKHTMGTCITCHRQRNASTECSACHI